MKLNGYEAQVFFNLSYLTAYDYPGAQIYGDYVVHHLMRRICITVCQ